MSEWDGLSTKSDAPREGTCGRNKVETKQWKVQEKFGGKESLLIRNQNRPNGGWVGSDAHEPCPSPRAPLKQTEPERNLDERQKPVNLKKIRWNVQGNL